MAPYLRGLIVRSALSLRAVETAFAVDSSGFSASKFVRDANDCPILPELVKATADLVGARGLPGAGRRQ